MDSVLLSLFVRNPSLELVARDMMHTREGIPEVDEHIDNLEASEADHMARIPYYLAYIELRNKGLIATLDRSCRIECLRLRVDPLTAPKQVTSALYLRAMTICI